tara:strand:- start:341 stop:550 length:210 start_codon:yes stop_codon:yes gene_type:complete
MKWIDNLTHKILSDKKLLLLVALACFLVYPLKYWTNARICDERNINNYFSGVKTANDKITQKYFEVLCD